MKIEKGTFIILGVLVVFVLYICIGILVKNKSNKNYGLAYVYNVRSERGPGLIGDYNFTIKSKKFAGTIGDGKQNFKKYFVVEFVKKTPWLCGIKIEIPINPNDLVPQPPEGWDECPINEDGSIKDKYKRRDKNGNIIKSKSVPKPSQKKKNSKVDEDIEREAMKLIMEKKK